MIITDIVQINIGSNKNKTAYKVYINYDYAFLLYSQDIKKYQLKTNEDITSITYNEIVEDTVYRRAKQKALAILKYMDRTEKELYTKLKESYYTEEIINRTIKYLKEYKYIDDKRYASSYIRSNKKTRSKLFLKTKLIQKGINKELLEKIIAIEYNIDSNGIDPELLAIRKAINKRFKNITNLSYEDKRKLIASLYRKGFNIDKIKKSLEFYDENN